MNEKKNMNQAYLPLFIHKYTIHLRTLTRRVRANEWELPLDRTEAEREALDFEEIRSRQKANQDASSMLSSLEKRLLAREVGILEEVEATVPADIDEQTEDGDAEDEISVNVASPNSKHCHPPRFCERRSRSLIRQL